MSSRINEYDDNNGFLEDAEVVNMEALEDGGSKDWGYNRGAQGSKLISTTPIEDPNKFLDIGGDHISSIAAWQKIPSYLASEKSSLQIVNNDQQSKEETKLEVIQDASQQEEEDECV